MEREPEELEGQGTEEGQDDPPVDGPGGGEDGGLGDTSQDSPGR